MNDRGKIFAGLVIFLALILFPIWYGVARGAPGPMPELEYPEEGSCVAERAWMRANHMSLLDDWRDEVVRGTGSAFFVRDGVREEKSLTRTCLGCHTDKEAFCDRCHDYADVTPYCWDCHLAPSSRVGRASRIGRDER